MVIGADEVVNRKPEKDSREIPGIMFEISVKAKAEILHRVPRTHLNMSVMAFKEGFYLMKCKK